MAVELNYPAAGLGIDPAAVDITGGTIDGVTITSSTIDGSDNTITNIGNSSLVNSSITVAGKTVSLGGSTSVAASDLSNGVSGSGAVVLVTGATLVAPNIGAATGSSLNLGSGALTAGATGVTTLTATKATAGDSGIFTNGGASNKSVYIYTDNTVSGIFSIANGGGNANAYYWNGTTDTHYWQINGLGSRMNLSSTGLAVTGALSATGSLTAGPTVSGAVGALHTLYSDNSSDVNALEIRQGRFNKTNLILSTNQTTGGYFLRVNENGTDVLTVGSGGAIASAGPLSLTGLTNHYVRGGAALFWNSTGASGGTAYGYIQTTTGSAMTLSASGGITLANNTSVSGMISGTALTANGAVAYKSVARSGTADAQIAFYAVDGTTLHGLFNSTANSMEWYDSTPTRKFRITSTSMEANSVATTLTGGNGDQLYLDNTGQRYTQLHFKNNTTAKADIYWDNDTATFNIRNIAGSTLAVSASTTVTGAASSYALTATGNASSGQAAYFNQKNTTATTSAGDIHHEATSGDNTLLKFFTEAAATLRGSITYNRGGGVVAYNTTSGRHFKQDIEDADREVSRRLVMRTRIRNYRWIENPAKLQIGVIADEVADKVDGPGFTGAVTFDAEGRAAGVDKTAWGFHQIATLQLHEADIRTLRRNSRITSALLAASILGTLALSLFN